MRSCHGRAIRCSKRIDKPTLLLRLELRWSGAGGTQQVQRIYVYNPNPREQLQKHVCLRHLSYSSMRATRFRVVGLMCKTPQTSCYLIRNRRREICERIIIGQENSGRGRILLRAKLRIMHCTDSSTILLLDCRVEHSLVQRLLPRYYCWCL